VPDLRTGWLHAALTISRSTLTAYVNGRACGSATGTGDINAAGTNMLLLADGLVGDEIRVTHLVRSEDWLMAECGQVNDRSFFTVGSATTKGTENYWLEEPSLSTRSAPVDEASSILIDAGRARYGAAILEFLRMDGTSCGNVMPSEAGAYRAVFTVNPASDGSRDGLVKEITFVLYTKRAYRAIGGYDRVMLFNSDSTPDCPVTGQGYYDVDDDTNMVWTSEGAAWTNAGRFVVSGTRHCYFEPNTKQTRKLWEFRHARLGNLFQQERGLTEGMHFLPWGGYAMRFDDSEMRANSQRYAGTLILQNVADGVRKTDPAGAYSQVFTNGIGTVYFDAVNAYELGDAVQNVLKVQVCYDNETDLKPEDDVTDGFWEDVPLDVFTVTNGVCSGSERTTEARLSIGGAHGTDASFYRIRAQIDTNVAVRVRIVRTDTYAAAASEDGVGLVLIDNIIVSHPAMGIALANFGAPAEPGNVALRGQRAPFDVAFPSAADLGKMRAQVKVNYLLSGTNQVDSSFIGTLTFKYRWRYLGQRVDAWKELTLLADSADPTRYVSTVPLEGAGVGDIEYFAEAVVNAPYYEYWDYTGGSWVWPDGYTERRGNVTLSGDRAVSPAGIYDESHLSPALGTDYFVRLRDGRSEYEGVRLYVKRTDDLSKEGVREEVVPLEVSANNLWRGFYQVVTNGISNLYYRVETYNRQTAVGGVYQWNTNWLYGVEQREIPANDVLKVGDGSQWTKLACDELTEYLLFQFEDTSGSISVIHADYQNFNAWSDANRPDGDENGHFVGTSTLLPTSGVGTLSVNITDGFGYLTETVRSNILWREAFELSGTEVVSTSGTWAINVPFSSAATPNGWSAANGQWVSEAFSELGGKSFAMQLNGEGYGTLTMPQDNCPRGIEKFTYRARVAQSYNQHPFNYYVGTTNDVYNLSTYTFAVPCAMQRLSLDPDFSGVGTVSAVARYRDSVGGYEARVERVSTNVVQLSLYKWGADGSAVLLGKSGESFDFGGMGGAGFDAYYNCFGGIFISCSNTPNSVRISAGILKQGQYVSAAMAMSGKNYHCICYEDFASDRYRTGTCGVGSKDCPATFTLPKFSNRAVAWPEFSSKAGWISNTVVTTSSGVTSTNAIWYTTKSMARAVNFPDERALMGSNPADLKLWNAYEERLPAQMYTNSSGQAFCAFKAKAPSQKIILETSPHLKGVWSPVSSNVVSTYGFVEMSHELWAADDLDVRLRTDNAKGGPDVVVDDLEAFQWRGEDYNTSGHPYSGVYGNLGAGAPSNFVFTTAWIGADGAIELSPMRTSVKDVNKRYPASVRSPLMDGKSDRGLGLGSFGFTYRDADPHARLIVQICTNGISTSTLSTRTGEYDTWTDVAVYDFSTLSENDRRNGTIVCYVGLHGVTGAMRVIVDPELVAEAHTLAANPDNDPAYGRVYVTMANAKDSPVVTGGNWWGWNLRTTDDPTMWLLKDGSKNDAGSYGLAYALNNSVTDDVRAEDSYEENMPFLQTPKLARAAVGEVSFKARKYAVGDAPPSVAIYGLREGADDFVFITNIVVDCDFYQTFTYQSRVSDNYRSFRLAVTGVAGIKDGACGPLPESGFVERVLIDEVLVYETIESRLGFRNVGAFRSQINDNDFVPNVPSSGEQPLCRESWGVQAEIYPVRLSDRIDYSREPQVFLHWYEGTSPWGYEKWKRNAAAHSARLSKAEGTNMVYRSSYLKSADAVIPMTLDAGTVIQYSLEVVYYMEGQSAPLTNVLTSTDWQPPSWYNPVDYNASFGKGESFSAFNILDEVAPGWAWINEINLFGAREKYQNTDKNHQFIEIAAPVEANLKGWSVRLLDVESDTVYTNRLATFGIGGLSATKSRLSSSNMVFHVIASPLTADEGKLRREDGTLDGTWNVQIPTAAIDANGVVAYYKGMGFQLVRKTGVVEHELVAIGTNLYVGTTLEQQYAPSNVVNGLNAALSGAKFFYTGADDGGKGNSLGVFESHGETSNVWNNVMVETPGQINAGQQISATHPMPYGSSITVYAKLLGDHIRQTVGKAVATNADQVVFIQKGSYEGTNITYTVDEWYEVADVAVTEGGPAWTYEPNLRQLTVNVGRNCSNDTLTVTARAQTEKRLRDLGCTDDNRYTPAIVSWLNGRKTLRDKYGFGLDWPDSNGAIYLADVAGANGVVVTNLSLTEMYWLDICPTISNQCLVGYVSKPAVEIPVGSDTNVDMTVFLMITNRDEVASGSPYAGAAWAPYAIRGLEPGVSSLDYEASSSWGWTNASFKVVGFLNNGLTDIRDEECWIPLRYFVFHEDSFENFQSRIQFPGPRSKRSLGYMAGWGEWFKIHPEPVPLYYYWRLDTRLVPVNVEILKPKNLLSGY